MEPEVACSGLAAAFRDHDDQTPVRFGCGADSDRIDASAVIRRSSPASFCNSPTANITARRALEYARELASLLDEDLREIALNVSRPTATTVSKIIRLSVTTRANPRSGILFWVFGFTGIGFRKGGDSHFTGNGIAC
jgi:hypothetical protein